MRAEPPASTLSDACMQASRSGGRDGVVGGSIRGWGGGGASRKKQFLDQGGSNMVLGTLDVDESAGERGLVRLRSGQHVNGC